jgi:hypothetical protein
MHAGLSRLISAEDVTEITGDPASYIHFASLHKRGSGCPPDGSSSPATIQAEDVRPATPLKIRTPIKKATALAAEVGRLMSDRIGNSR